MFTYDKESNTLIIRQFNDYPLDFDVLADQKESYKKYLEKGIFEDAKYFLEKLNAFMGTNDIDADFELGPLYDSNYRRDVKKRSNKYYPLYATFYNAGVSTPKVLLMRVPYMDAECKLNVDGQSKVVLLEQTASNDISYSSKTSTLTIQSKNLSTNFQTVRRGVMIKLPTKKYEGLDAVIRGLLYAKGMNTDLSDIYRNSFILETSNFSPYYNDCLHYESLKGTRVYENMMSVNASLVYARDSLNDVLQIDACLSQTLSRKTLDYPAGTVVTPKMLAEFKKNKINCVYVRDMPKVNGWLLDEDLIFDYIPKGTPNCKFLQEDSRFEKEHNNAFLSEDYYAGRMDLSRAIFFPAGYKLTIDDLEFLSIMGVDSIKCRKSKTADPKTFYFEREILGNYSFRVSDLYDNPPEGLNAEDWIYCYPNGDTEDTDHLTVYDLEALLSLLARIYTTGVIPILNKDTSYLKKVNLIGDTFSLYFRRIVPKFLSACKRKLQAFLLNRAKDDMFYGLYSSWRKAMLEGRVLVSADTVNAMAEMSQVCHVTTLLNNSSSVDDAMRNLAIPYFGRTCPYETPAGKKLGLVNTKALGSKIVKGLPCVPYRAVIKDGNLYKLSDKVRYMSVKEEQRYRLGDLTLLDWCEDGIHFRNSQTIAIVPNPDSNGTSMMFALVESGNLDYVTCHSEQHVSPTTCLIPYAKHDDANRISFGLSQIRQCIYLWHSDAPRVRTFMHTLMFKHPNSFLVRAERSGVVEDITKDCISVTYDGDTEWTDIVIEESRITNDSMLFMNYKKEVGERFNKGDVLVDTVASREGIYSAGRSELVAYLATGYNHEDGIDVSDAMTYDFISIGSHSVERKVRSNQARATKIGNINQFHYINKGDAVMELNLVDRRDTNSVTKLEVISEDEEGLLYNIEQAREKSGTVYRGNMICLNKLKPGDKMAGCHGNKGVVTHVCDTSKAPQLANGMSIKICLNPHGVPSRMNMGQIYECHTGLIAVVLNTNIQTDPFNGANADDLSMLMEFSYKLANTPNIRTRSTFDAIASQYKQLPKEFIEHCYENLDTTLEWTGTFNEEGDARLWDPQTDTWFEYPITIGFSTMLKLMQEGDEKKHSRSGVLEEPYNTITKQPPQGSRKKGGQRDGEMELVGVAAHGATQFLREICNEKSDNEGERSNIHLKALGYALHNDEKYCVPRSYETLSYELEALGVKLDTLWEPELPDLDYEYASKKSLYDVRTIAHKDPDMDPTIDDTTETVMSLLDKAFNMGGNNEQK